MYPIPLYFPYAFQPLHAENGDPDARRHRLASDDDGPTLEVEDPDHLITVPGTERVIGSPPTQTPTPKERKRDRVTDRYRKSPRITPRSIGRLPDPTHSEG